MKMKALILNSGMGSRMGVLTSEHPKCMTEIDDRETILSHQLKLLVKFGITEVVMTTGYFDRVLTDYCHGLGLPVQYRFVNNPIYNRTNYIYSIFLAKEYLNDDIVLLHGDLVFEESVLFDALSFPKSCMTVSSAIPLPSKDFKAVIFEDRIVKVGVEFFENALAAQPFYKLCQQDWNVWLDRIIGFCEAGKVSCYAENALNEVTDRCYIYPLDIQNRLCNEIDTPEDLKDITQKLKI